MRHAIEIRTCSGSVLQESHAYSACKLVWLKLVPFAFLFWELIGMGLIMAKSGFNGFWFWSLSLVALDIDVIYLRSQITKVGLKQETGPILLVFKFFKGQQMDWFTFILA